MNRARIGLLVPSSNTTVESEFRRLLPDSISLHCARLFIDKVDLATIGKMTDTMDHEARMLASADVDVVVLGATAPSFLLGLGHDKAVAAQLEAITGKPATTTSSALLAGLAKFGVTRAVLGSPWTDAVSGACAQFLEANGVEILSNIGLDVVDNLEIGRLPVRSAFDVAVAADHPDAQAIVLACTNWPTLEVIDEIEQKLGKPVISTGPVSAWQALRMVGHDEPLPGFGALMTRF
ncbi:aspartate/glutamate racemase family protein [soil metagenome]